jgi:hypothetical protein
MDQLLQQFEAPIVDRNGDLHTVYLYGRARPGDTWQGWLVFERQRDRQRFTSPVETTQTNREAVLYWATGLTDAYFDGALERAQRPADPAQPHFVAVDPLVDYGVDHDTREARLAHIERDILAFFTKANDDRVLTETLFSSLPHAHADVVRALEDLEKQKRAIERRTEEGNDWVFIKG